MAEIEIEREDLYSDEVGFFHFNVWVCGALEIAQRLKEKINTFLSEEDPNRQYVCLYPSQMSEEEVLASSKWGEDERKRALSHQIRLRCSSSTEPEIELAIRKLFEEIDNEEKATLVR